MVTLNSLAWQTCAISLPSIFIFGIVLLKLPSCAKLMIISFDLFLFTWLLSCLFACLLVCLFACLLFACLLVCLVAWLLGFLVAWLLG